MSDDTLIPADSDSPAKPEGLVGERKERKAKVRDFAGRSDGLIREEEYEFGTGRSFAGREDGKTREFEFEGENDVRKFEKINGVSRYTLSDGSVETGEERDARLHLAVAAPAPAFERLERVLIGEQSAKYHGEQGTVLWSDWARYRKDGSVRQLWQYIVYLQADNSWRTFRQSDLKSLGAFDVESSHLSQRPEISFDLVMEKDNNWMEGSFRLPGESWQCMSFNKRDVADVCHKLSQWQRATTWGGTMTGISFSLPQTACVDRNYLLGAMTQVFGFSEWIEVHGPDSMFLR